MMLDDPYRPYSLDECLVDAPELAEDAADCEQCGWPEWDCRCVETGGES